LETLTVVYLLRNPEDFMESTGWLPCYERPAAQPCPEPLEPTPYSPRYFFKINVIANTSLPYTLWS
jgi:hypothetical protein